MIFLIIILRVFILLNTKFHLNHSKKQLTRIIFSKYLLEKKNNLLFKIKNIYYNKYSILGKAVINIII